MPGAPIHEVLAGLSSDHPESAWDVFVKEYSSQILHVARRYENDADQVSDCYIFVCEYLSVNKFARLLKFDPDGSASFRTWLTVVVSNLCKDWRRSRYGRVRAMRVIQQLTTFEQAVFRDLYEHGMTRIECLHTLSHQYPDISEQHIAETNSRIHSLLSPQQRWRLLARKAQTISLNEKTTAREIVEQPENPGPETEILVQSTQDQEILEAAMAQLTADERLILRLRYEQDLTLDEVAQLMNLADRFRARRQIEAAIAKLGKYMDA